MSRPPVALQMSAGPRTRPGDEARLPMPIRYFVATACHPRECAPRFQPYRAGRTTDRAERPGDHPARPVVPRRRGRWRPMPLRPGAGPVPVSQPAAGALLDQHRDEITHRRPSDEPCEQGDDAFLQARWPERRNQPLVSKHSPVGPPAEPVLQSSRRYDHVGEGIPSGNYSLVRETDRHVFSLCRNRVKRPTCVLARSRLASVQQRSQCRRRPSARRPTGKPDPCDVGPRADQGVRVMSCSMALARSDTPLPVQLKGRSLPQ